MKIKTFIVVTIILVNLVSSIEVYAEQNKLAASYPVMAWSFDNKFAVNNSYNSNYIPDKPNGPNNKYTLLLTNTDDGYKTNVLYEYSRAVSVVWSPIADSLFVNDYAGSDNANCIVFNVTDHVKKISIYDELNRLMPTNKTIFKQANDPEHINDHVYITCNKWLGNDSVLIKIYGHGDIDPNGFTLWYKYKVGGSFQFIKKENIENQSP